MRPLRLLSSLLLYSAVAEGGGFVGVPKRNGACLICQIGVVDFLENGADGVLTGGVRYRCITDETQEGDGEPNMVYNIDLPSYFTYANKETLDTGVSRICIIGGSAVRTPLGQPDYVVIPEKAKITFVDDGAERRLRRLEQVGIRSVLVVRVTAPNSTQSTNSSVITNSIFGIGGQNYSTASMYSSCSFGKLTMTPATGFGQITNGVMDLALNESVVGKRAFDLENIMQIAVKDALGVPDLGLAFNFVIFCMPYGSLSATNSVSWIAYAYRPGQYSYQNNGFCATLSNPVHELGHNLGLQHSNERTATGGPGLYGDNTCVMGSTFNTVGSPAMCFNGHKNHILGWYADKQITTDPATQGPYRWKLVGFVDYPSADTSRSEFVLINVDTLYIQFNLQARFNYQTKEYPNRVTIVNGTSSDRDSSLIGTLLVGQTYVSGIYAIQCCEMVNATASTPKYMVLSIRLNGQGGSCQDPFLNDLTTLQPTTPPTALPSLLPTEPPTPVPSLPPTEPPTEAPINQATATSSPVTLAPTLGAPVLPPSLIDGICEDSKSETVFLHGGLQRSCAWLATRPLQKATYCVTGNPVYTLCEEACGRCEDNCSDSTTDTFLAGENGNKLCNWLSVRSSLHPTYCGPGNAANEICKETCESCVSETVPPTSPPVTVCEDSTSQSVFTYGLPRSCAYLNYATALKQTYCAPTHYVSSECPEACGLCDDFCSDHNTLTYYDAGTLKNQTCVWLALRPTSISAECVPGRDAYNICRETCESCSVRKR